MKSKLLRIFGNIMAMLSHSNNRVYGVPDNDMIFVPRTRNVHTKTKAESKKCKSCRKFGTASCYVRYVGPLSVACENYQSKRKK